MRTEKDYAIEFGEYLATAAEAFLTVDVSDEDAILDCGRALRSAIYEFRKRTAKARASENQPVI